MKSIRYTIMLATALVPFNEGGCTAKKSTLQNDVPYVYFSVSSAVFSQPQVGSWAIEIYMEKRPARVRDKLIFYDSNNTHPKQAHLWADKYACDIKPGLDTVKPCGAPCKCLSLFIIYSIKPLHDLQKKKIRPSAQNHTEEK